MEVEILQTERCILRPVIKEDANWLFDLLNDPDVVEYIEGINWFNSDVVSVQSFIETMKINAVKDLGAMWCVEYQKNNIGFILAYDLKDNPFLSFALLPNYRNHHFGSEVITLIKKYISQKFQTPRIETSNPVVKGIVRKLPVILYLGDTFCQSLQSFRDIIEKLNLRNKKDLDILYNVIALLRDGTLLSWLEYLSETGDGDAFDIASTIRSIPTDIGEKELKRQVLNLFRPTILTNWEEEQRVPIKLLENAKINFGEGPEEFNIFLPINTNKNYSKAKFTVLFKITDIRNDILKIGIGNDIQELSLKRRKTQSISFNVILEDTIEQEVILNIDGTPFHKFIIQSYPSLEWSDDECIYHGIRDLYLQDYSKARLCFERVQSSAGSFLLGLMSYIGALGRLDATKSLNLLKKAKDKKDGEWSKMANALMAVMALKGEGHTLDNFTEFETVFLPDGNSGEFIRKAIKGIISSEKYDSLIYSYNMAESELKPTTIIDIKGRTIQGRFNNITGRLEIRFHKDWSELIGFKIADVKSLHAYIGFKVNGEDWHYTIQDDWNNNTPFNTFILNKESSMWELTIDNVRTVHNIPIEVSLQQVNIIIRDDFGKIKLEPNEGSCFVIDTYASKSHVALCNLTPLLFYLSGNSNPSPNLGIEYKTLPSC